MQMRKLRNLKKEISSLLDEFDVLAGKLALLGNLDAELLSEEVADLGACSELLLDKLTSIPPAELDDGEFFAICRLVRELTELQKLIDGFADYQDGHHEGLNTLQMAH